MSVQLNVEEVHGEEREEVNKDGRKNVQVRKEESKEGKTSKEGR